MRIIDKDIDFYVNEVEECTRKLRNCDPNKETYWKERRLKAEKVVRALFSLRTVIDCMRDIV